MDSLKTRTDHADKDLQSRVVTFLSSRHFPAFRNLSVSVSDGAVHVSGKLNSFYAKQVALNTCQRVAGVLELIDKIEVDDLPKKV
jgi:osmotically-inducible protein OsmY